MIPVRSSHGRSLSCRALHPRRQSRRLCKRSLRVLLGRTIPFAHPLYRTSLAPRGQIGCGPHHALLSARRTRRNRGTDTPVRVRALRGRLSHPRSLGPTTGPRHGSLPRRPFRLHGATQIRQSLPRSSPLQSSQARVGLRSLRLTGWLRPRRRNSPHAAPRDRRYTRTAVKVGRPNSTENPAWTDTRKRPRSIVG